MNVFSSPYLVIALYLITVIMLFLAMLFSVSVILYLYLIVVMVLSFFIWLSWHHEKGRLPMLVYNYIYPLLQVRDMMQSLERRLHSYFAWIALYLLLTCVGVALALYEFRMRDAASFNAYVALGSIAMAIVGMALLVSKIREFEGWLERVSDELSLSSLHS